MEKREKVFDLKIRTGHSPHTNTTHGEQITLLEKYYINGILQKNKGLHIITKLNLKL